MLRRQNIAVLGLRVVTLAYHSHGLCESVSLKKCGRRGARLGGGRFRQTHDPLLAFWQGLISSRFLDTPFHIGIALVAIYVPAEEDLN